MTSSIDSFITILKRQPWYQGQIEIVRVIPGQAARYGVLEKPLPDPVNTYLNRENLTLYTHQVKAIEQIRGGENVILTTPTASGKTLAFNLPIFEHLYHDRRATALYLYPLKALANDQLEKLHQLERATGIALGANIYDGDTPQHLRPRIREISRIIVSNPYALHQYLPWHHKWARFFKHLKFVVIDEAHRYRGVFGSNVAMLIRRLARILERHGADPQFILSSATIANPEEHAHKLIGKDVTVIAEDGSDHGDRYFLFWNPVHYPDHSVHRQTSDLLRLHATQGFQTLCFTISRAMAELTARWAKEATNGEVKIAVYRAGYLPEERREIERALRDRELDAVASTNALELGIDIGELDAVIIAGYPGTVVSTWQQAGRAGRGTAPAAVTLVGFENPLDQYFMRHPDRFFERPHEHAIIDLDNLHIKMGHLMCAAAELPLRQVDEKQFGDFAPLLEPLEDQGLLGSTPVGWVYQGTARPVDVVNLDNISNEIVEVICDGETLETMEVRQAYAEAHPGAVLLHQGETYLVSDLDLERNTATVVKEEVDHYTDALQVTKTRILNPVDWKDHGDFELAVGNLHVAERFVSYQVRRYDRVLGRYELDLPPIEFETVGVWFTVPDALRQAVIQRDGDWVGGLHGAEHAMIAMTPFHAMCDRWDIGGLSTPYHPDTGAATIFIYDGFEGGMGISEKIFQLFPELVKTTYELIRDCGCEMGCPSCIYSPKCGNQNEPLDKAAALTLLKGILARV
ncbi:MAG: DEAD/DEAH box helicase [Candidatus Bipolaricaulia bacterium]